jgi:hypothetical protein
LLIECGFFDPKEQKIRTAVFLREQVMHVGCVPWEGEPKVFPVSARRQGRPRYLW